MQVIYGLAAVFARVDHGAKSLCQPLRGCQFSGDREHIAEQGRMLAGCVRERLQVEAGYDEKVDGGLRMEVGKGDYLIILVQ